MPKREKLLEKALNSPKNLRFEELCALAREFGFVERETRSGTSHSHKYRRPGFWKLLNFQNDDGKAKPYQVRELLDALRELGEID